MCDLLLLLPALVGLGGELGRQVINAHVCLAEMSHGVGYETLLLGLHLDRLLRQLQRSPLQAAYLTRQ